MKLRSFASHCRRLEGRKRPGKHRSTTAAERKPRWRGSADRRHHLMSCLNDSSCCLSSREGRGRRGLVGPSVAQEGPEDMDAAAGEGEDCLCAASWTRCADGCGPCRGARVGVDRYVGSPLRADACTLCGHCVRGCPYSRLRRPTPASLSSAMSRSNSSMRPRRQGRRAAKSSTTSRCGSSLPLKPTTSTSHPLVFMNGPAYRPNKRPKAAITKA